MSGITGTEVRKLMEAYNAVYECNNIKEEFEKWVSELVEEGYDFSEHTWSEVADVYFYLNTENLNEVAVLAAPLAAPIAAGITGLVGGAAKLAQDLQRQRQTRQQEPVDYGQMSPGTVFRAGTHDPTSGPKDRTQSAAERLRAQQPTGQQVSAADLEKKAKEAKARAQQPKPEQPPTPPSTPSQHGARIGRTYPKPEEPKPPKGPKEPNAAQKFLASKWKEFRQSVGSGGKDAQGRGITAAAGNLLGSTVRTPVRQTLDVVRKVGTPLIAPAVGVGAAWKGVSDLMNPKTSAGKWIRGVREDYEIGDILINYLIEEKYAKDEKSALSIVENMSEKWAVSILEQYFEL